MRFNYYFELHIPIFLPPFLRSLMTMGFQPCIVPNFPSESGLTHVRVGCTGRARSAFDPNYSDFPILLFLMQLLNIDYILFLFIFLLTMHFLNLCPFSCRYNLIIPFLHLPGKLHSFFSYSAIYRKINSHFYYVLA